MNYGSTLGLTEIDAVEVGNKAAECKQLTIEAMQDNPITKAIVQVAGIAVGPHFVSYAFWLLRKRRGYWVTVGKVLYETERGFGEAMGHRSSCIEKDWRQELESAVCELKAFGIERLGYDRAKRLILRLWYDFKVENGLDRPNDRGSRVNRDDEQLGYEVFNDAKAYWRSPFLRPDATVQHYGELDKESQFEDRSQWAY